MSGLLLTLLGRNKPIQTFLYDNIIVQSFQIPKLLHDLLIYSNLLFLSTQPNGTLVDFDSMSNTFLKIQSRALHILPVVTLNTCIGGIHSSVSIQ